MIKSIIKLTQFHMECNYSEMGAELRKGEKTKMDIQYLEEELGQEI